MQYSSNDDLIYKEVCLDNYSLSCLFNCFEWILDARIKANDQDFNLVSIVVL